MLYNNGVTVFAKQATFVENESFLFQIKKLDLLTNPLINKLVTSIKYQKRGKDPAHLP